MNHAHTFIFDFDSTLFPGESLDEIIISKLMDDPQAMEKSKQIAAICKMGMSGAIGMEDSLKKRLAIATPDRATIKAYIKKNKTRIDARLLTLLEAFIKSGHDVFVVSGGFEEWIGPILENVLPAPFVHANQILNQKRPMTFENLNIRSKENIIKNLPLQKGPVVIIGDGATDFSVFENGLAQQYVGTFFYTGIEAREKLVEKALRANQLIFSELDTFIDYMKLAFLAK